MPSGSNVPCCSFAAIKNLMENYPAERFKENCAGPCEIAIIPNCDHFYVGAEEKVAKIVNGPANENVRVGPLTLPSPASVARGKTIQ